MKKLLNYTIGFLILVVVVTQVVKIYIANTTALDSIEASQLAAQIREVEESNMDLRSKVLALSSYQNVASKAADLGLKETREIVSVYDPVKVAVSR